MRNLLTLCLMVTVLFSVGAGVEAQSEVEGRVKQELLYHRVEGEAYDIKARLEKIGQPEQVNKILIDVVTQYKYHKLGSMESMLYQSATGALGELRVTGAIGPLTANLKDRRVDKIKRAFSARALGQIDPDRSKQSLLEVLRDKSIYYDIRVEAAQALAKTRDPEVLRVLEQYAREEQDTFTRKQFEKAVQEMKANIQRSR